MFFVPIRQYFALLFVVVAGIMHKIYLCFRTKSWWCSSGRRVEGDAEGDVLSSKISYIGAP